MKDLVDFVTDRRILPLCMQHVSLHGVLTFGVHEQWGIRKHIEWAVSYYNTKRPHSSLNYMTPEEFESAILNEDFKKKWLEKETGRYKHVELLERTWKTV